MKIVKLKSQIENGSVVFSVSDPIVQPAKYFSLTQVKELKELYKERHQLNSWRTFDKSIMRKEFGI